MTLLQQLDIYKNQIQNQDQNITTLTQTLNEKNLIVEKHSNMINKLQKQMEEQNHIDLQKD